MSGSRVLVVEDERDIADLIVFHLGREGFDAAVAASGREALELVDRIRPVMVLLDIMLPDIDGLEVCRRLKHDKSTRSIPIVMISARGEESDVVVGLELGAEDYVTKPFSPRVLLARVRAVLRRNSTQPSEQIVAGSGALAIDTERHKVRVNGDEIELTLTQYKLLQFLAARPGHVRTRDQIVAAVRGRGVVLSSRAVDVHVAGLRRKLGDAGMMIETVRGVGYRFADEPATLPA